MRVWKTVRVFISSAFRDMHAERDYLVRFVFPELRERCAKRCLHLIDVDLRWGVTEEEAKQSKVVEICLDEVERCRPFFIGLLGERYGRILSRHELPARPDYDWLKEFAEGNSITALEILQGVFRDPQLHTRSFFYFRDPSFLKDVPKEKQADFLSESEEAAEKLRRLKNEIKETSTVFENYPCAFDGVDKNGNVHLTGLEEFGIHVLEDLWDAISDEFLENNGAVDELALERSYHEAFIESSTRNFIGRRDVLHSLKAFADNGDENTLVVTGLAGCGKSATLATFAKEYAERNQEAFVLTHFIGVSPGSTDIRRTLLRLCKELRGKFGLRMESTTDFYELRQAFMELLKSSVSRGRTLLVIDALDQLDDNHDAHNLDWLPRVLPEGIKVIVSMREGDCLDSVRYRNPKPREVTVGPLSEEERREIVRQTLRAYRKTLDETQMRLFLEKRDSDNPLYLIVGCEEMRVYGDFQSLLDKLKSLADSVDSLFLQVLERVEHDHGGPLVEAALSLLECSRHGLFESEMLELLARVGEAQLPQAIWARLYRSIQFYLRPRGQDAEGTLDFFHVKFAESVRQKYLKDKRREILVHQYLAAYFQSKADPGNDKSWSGNDPHAFSELAYHQLAGQLHDDLFRTAREEAFLRKQNELFTDDLELQLQTLQNAITGAAQINDAAKMVEFIFRHGRQVRIFGAELPFQVFRETGNLDRAVNLCEIWFQRDREIGTLHFLWLAWELKKHDLMEDANGLLCSLARREKELPTLSKKEWKTLAVVALAQIADLDYQCFIRTLRPLFDDSGILDLITHLFTAGEQDERNRIRVALAAANDIYAPFRKVQAYTTIARAQANAGEDTTESFKKATQAVGKEHKASRHFLYELIANTQAQTGRGEDALKTVAKIDEAILKEDVYKSIAQTHAQLGEYDKALRLVREVSNDYDKHEIAIFVAKAQAQTGKYEDSLKTLSTFGIKHKDNEIYSLIVQSQVAAGEFKAAFETTEKIPHPVLRIKAQASIAQAAATSGERETKTLERAFVIAKGISHPINISSAYIVIAQARVATGQDSTATIELASRATEEIDDPVRKADAYNWIASIKVRAGKDGTESLELALRSAAKIENALQRVNAFTSIATVQANTGNDITTILHSAVETADGLKSYDKRKAYKIIVGLQAQSGKYADVLKTIERLEDPDHKTELYQSIVPMRVETDSAEIFDLALNLITKPAEELNVLLKKANAYTAIGTGQSQAGKDGTRAFELALAIIDQISDPLKRAQAYQLVGAMQGQAGADATKTFAMALKAIEKISDWYVQAKTYARMASALNIARRDAQPIFDLALQAAAKIDSSFQSQVAYELIVTNQIETDMYLAALETVEKVQDKKKKIRFYLLLAQGLAWTGEYATAFKTAAKIRNKEQRATAHVRIAEAKASAGDFEAALEIVDRIKESDQRNDGYNSIVHLRLRSGMYQEAWETIRKIDDPYWRAESYLTVAKVHAQAGEFERALEIVAEIDNDYWKVDGYKLIALIQIEAGEDAAATFDLALKTAAKINDLEDKVDSYESIAKAQAQVGKDTTMTFDLAWKTVDEIDDQELKARVNKSIVDTQAGKDSLNEYLFSGMNDILQRYKKLDFGVRDAKEHIKLAVTQVNAGEFERAIRTVESISVNRDQSLSQVGWALASQNNKRYLKKLLLPSSYYLSTCYEISCVLAVLYNEQADAILEVFSNN